MSDLILTEEEINQILMSSPYALPSSPSQAGLGANQIKRYFYSFIVLFCQKLNLRFDEIAQALYVLEDVLSATDDRIDEATQDLTKQIGTSLNTHNQSISAHGDIRADISRLWEKNQSTIQECTELIVSRMETHNTENTAHGDIRELVPTHNQSKLAHSDIRELVGQAKEKADNAYNLASGKSKVHWANNIVMMFGDLYDNPANVNVGDVYIVLEKNVPEFIILGKGGGAGNAISFSMQDLVSGASPNFTAGELYYLTDKQITVIAMESGIDTSNLATNEQLSALDTGLTAYVNENLSRFYNEYISVTEAAFDEIHEYAEALKGGEA